MLIKLAVIALLLFIIVNLVLAGRAMLKTQPSGEPMSRYLGRRVLYSVLVLLIIFVAIALGLIETNPRPY